MRTTFGLLVVSFWFATAAPSALAQSNPFAGSTWTGTASFQDSFTCTCAASGSYTCPPSQVTSCTSSVPWSGNVDAQGNFTLGTQAGTETCNDGSSYPVPANASELFGPVQPDGTMPIPAFSSSTAGGTSSCPASSLRFSLSPARVSGGQSCTTTTSTSTSDTSGTLSFNCTGSQQLTFAGSGGGTGGTAPPPFPMTVSSDITPTTANATAQVQPPSQLVGTTASVYVFAHVPLSKLAKRATAPVGRKDDPVPDPCVLAQLDPNGQLAAASGSALQAFTTGVVTSQGQSVTILNNVATPNVAGASFYVGYGATSSAMLSSGLYEGAVSVQGASSCSAALLTGAAPNAPSALTGLWWNPNESGWGISFTQRRNIVFGAWYTYDASGNPKWYAATDCAMPDGVTGTSGTCNGSLYEVSGPAFFGTAFDPTRVQPANVGSLQVSFQDANNASMTYTVNGQSRTVPITRQLFQAGTTPPAVDYTDLWWNPKESGWGIVATQQYGLMFLAWYVYDAGGKPTWYVATNCVVVGSGCSGTLYRTVGPPFGPTFNPAAVHPTAVGTIGVSFTDANNATLTYTVNGSTGTKSITRQVF